MNWMDKRVVIIGAARQGTALARWLVKQNAKVTVTDLRSAAELAEALKPLSTLPIEWVLGKHPESLLDGADLVCPSGGVPLTSPLVQAALERNIPLSNDSEIFLELAPCPTIGITGSAGKTTTTLLVGEIANAAKGQVNTPFRRTYVGGNIGSPLIAKLDDMQAHDLAVMELSSFQLDLMLHSPWIAAVLNITPNHLDRHGSMAAYTAAKTRILTHQSKDDMCVLGRENEASRKLAEMARGQVYTFGRDPLPNHELGSYVENEAIWLRTEDGDQDIMSVSEIKIRGQHNLLNALAATALAGAAGFSPEAIQAGIANFQGAPHRIEFIRRHNGVSWYNDSKATSPAAVLQAMRSFDEPLVLLAGGQDKNLPWDEFAKEVNQRVDHLILFGEAAPAIKAALEVGDYTLHIEPSLQPAVMTAARLAQAGHIALLSPGGTSWDEFKDFEDRGEWFRAWVLALK